MSSSILLRLGKPGDNKLEPSLLMIGIVIGRRLYIV
jgi:hypothetical protein